MTQRTMSDYETVPIGGDGSSLDEWYVLVTDKSLSRLSDFDLARVVRSLPCRESSRLW